jgi:putative SOS response-associated peptidase YedK
MCGRFALEVHIQLKLYEDFGISSIPAATPRYNIAPSQQVIGVREVEGRREAVEFRWGLIPVWAKDMTIGYKMINARAETIREKPSFKQAFNKRPCLILASGFYEWQKTPAGKQPIYFYLKDKRVFGFAGLWEKWRSPEGKIIESCTIITTKANEMVSGVHERMPVIVGRSDHAMWLSNDERRQDERYELLRPYPAGEMERYRVSTLVNSPKNESPELIQPL